MKENITSESSDRAPYASVLGNLMVYGAPGIERADPLDEWVGKPLNLQEGRYRYSDVESDL